MGLYAEWQPHYAEAGLRAFPVDAVEKKPAIGNYLKVGLFACAALAKRKRFADADRFGIACGKRNGLVVVDIDEPDEALLRDALDLLGPTPIVVRTQGGNFHAWYRWSGEHRGNYGGSPIPGRKIEILGDGFVIAPPSLGDRGPYQFIAGSLADVASLPKLLLPVNDLSPAPEGPSSELVPVGERNRSLFHALLPVAAAAGSLDALALEAKALNGSMLAKPLPDDEAMKVVGNVWRITQEGKNWCGSKGMVSMPRERLDFLLSLGPDPHFLAMHLLGNHWGRDVFAIADALGPAMPGGSWTKLRLRNARNALLAAGVIVRLRNAGPGYPALFRFGAKISPAGIVGEAGGRG